MTRHDAVVLGQHMLNVDAAIEAVGFGKMQFLLLLYTGLAWFADAMEVMILSYLGPALHCDWQLSPAGESVLSSVVFAGMMAGACVWGSLADWCGRRRAFAAVALLTLASSGMSAAAPSFWVLLAARGLVGFGLAGVPVLYTLFMECIPAKGRGGWLVAVELFWTLGTAFEAGLAWLLLGGQGWRVLLLASAAPLVLLVALLPLVPESPRYLAVRGRSREAAQVLQRMAAINGRSLEAAQLWVALPTSCGGSSSSSGAAALEVCSPAGGECQEHEEAPLLSSTQQWQQQEKRQQQQQHAHEHVQDIHDTQQQQLQQETTGPPDAAGLGQHAAASCSLSTPRHRARTPPGLSLELSSPTAADPCSTHHAAQHSSRQPTSKQPSSAPGLHPQLSFELSSPASAASAASAASQASSSGQQHSQQSQCHSRSFSPCSLLHSPAGSHHSSGSARAPLLSPSKAGSLAPAGAALLASLQQLFSPRLRHTSVLLLLVWFATALGYYGIVIITTQLTMGQTGSTGSGGEGEHGGGGGGPPRCSRARVQVPDGDFGAILAASAAELPSLLLAVGAMAAVGRRAAMAACMLGTAAALAALPAAAGLPGGTAALLFAARLFVMAGFTVLYIYTPEVYPTGVRTLGLGVCNACSRLGGLVAPLVAVWLLQTSGAVVAEVGLAVACVAAGVGMALLRQETAGQGLVDE